MDNLRKNIFSDKDEFKKLIKNTAYDISPVNYLKLLYYKRFHKKLDLENPTGFNEKMLWMMLYYRNPLMVQCTDKYGLREYVEERGLEKLLPKNYGVYNNSKEIPWGDLPNKFVLKCTHGSRYNIICEDKSTLDIKKVSLQLDEWLAEDYSYGKYEKHYAEIEPRIICEELLELESGENAVEYNLYCFNGEPKVVLVYAEGTPHTENKSIFYDLNWNQLDIGAETSNVQAEEPSYLEDLIEYSKELSAPFPFVRVDFYGMKNEPILGELTFTSGAGMSETYSEEGNEFLGSLMELPKNNIKE